MTSKSSNKIKRAYDPSVPYNYSDDSPSMTHQSFKEECDINRIMKKWEKTGIIEHRNTFEGNYADFTTVPTDYHTAMNSILAAEEMFMTLPAAVRKKFHNDPGEFLDFADNPENLQEMQEMGLTETDRDWGDLEEPTRAQKASKKATEEPPKEE